MKGFTLSQITGDARILSRCANGFDWNEINDDEPLYFGADRDITFQWSSTSSKLAVTGAAASNLVQFGSSDYGFQFKIHNRPATSGNTLEVRARPSSTTAQHAAVDSTLDYRPSAAGLASYNRAVQGVSRLDTDYTVTGGAGAYFAGVYGQFANNGTLNGASIFGSAIYGLIEDGGVYTAVGHVSALWLDSHLDQTVTSGATEFAYITNNGDTTFDNVFYIYAGNKITNLFTIETASGMVSDSTTADYTFTKTRKIKVVAGGETGYLIMDIV